MPLVCVPDSLRVRILVIYNITCILCYQPMKGAKARDDLLWNKLCLIIPWCSVKIFMHNLVHVFSIYLGMLLVVQVRKCVGSC